MTAIAYTEHELDRAYEVAAEIGRAVRRVRMARGETQREAALALQIDPHTIGYIERSAEPNLRLALAVKVLERFGYTLAVVPKIHQRAGDGAGV